MEFSKCSASRNSAESDEKVFLDWDLGLGSIVVYRDWSVFSPLSVWFWSESSLNHLESINLFRPFLDRFWSDLSITISPL